MGAGHLLALQVGRVPMHCGEAEGGDEQIFVQNPLPLSPVSFGERFAIHELLTEQKRYAPANEVFVGTSAPAGGHLPLG